MNDLANISVANARLPATYEQAKNALAACDSLDECKDWADKAAALASYAKQSNDQELRKLADRIQVRAIRRAGELLKSFDGRGGDHSKTDGDDSFAPPTRQEAARNAGMTERQQVTAGRVANIPQEQFDEEVEGDTPPTVSKLAEAGKKTRPASTEHLQGRPPEQFYAATHTMGAMRRFAGKAAEYDAAYVAGGVLPDELPEARKLVAAIDAWLDRFVVNLKG